MLIEKHSLGTSAWLLTLLIPLFIACGSSDKARPRLITHFPHELTLDGEGLDSLNRYPGLFGINRVGEHWLFYQKSDYYFTLLDADFSFVKRLARRGNGAGEFIAPSYMGQCVDGQLHLLERPTGELFALGLEEGAKRKSLFKSTSNKELSSLVYLFRLGDGRYLAAGDQQRFTPFVYDETTQQITLFDEVGALAHLDEASRFYLAQHCAAVNLPRERVAIAYFSLPQLEIRTLAGEVVAVITLDDEAATTALSMAEEPRDYFSAICTTDTALYALYQPAESDETMTSQLVIFDWEGNPKSRLTIPRAVAFVVDEERRRIIALNEDDRQFVASWYALP